MIVINLIKKAWERLTCNHKWKLLNVFESSVWDGDKGGIPAMKSRRMCNHCGAVKLRTLFLYFQR